MDTSAWPPVYLAWLATVVKWLAVLCAVVVLVHAWCPTPLASGPGELSDDRRAAMLRLRWPAMLLLTWGLFLIFDPTGQAPDSFRRWFDSFGRFAGSAALTLAAAALLGTLTWTTTRRAILAQFPLTGWGPRRWAPWAVLAGVPAVLAWKPGWLNLLGIAITIVIVFALSGLARILGLGSDEPRVRRVIERNCRHPVGDRADRVPVQPRRRYPQRFVYIAPPQSPGIPAPLVWTTSDMGMDDLDRQRAKAFAPVTAAAELRRVLEGGAPACRERAASREP